MPYRPADEGLNWLDRRVERISADIGVIVPDRPAYVRFGADTESAA